MNVSSVLVLIISCFAFTSARKNDECLQQYPVNDEDLENFTNGSLQNAMHMADYLCCFLKSIKLLENDGTVDLDGLDPYAYEDDEIAKLNQCKAFRSVSCSDKDTFMKFAECVRDFTVIVEIE
ncbi:hypothetical protein FQR65_LT01831 [Abscondita terminalis]|nr:hypothetical protein FQR65_LT01831 [Abscondita terminalis]